MKRFLTAFLIVSTVLLFPSNAYAEEEETFISQTAYEACVEYGDEYGICPEFIMAIIERESCGQPDVENGSCKGLMQVSVKWHKDRMERLGVTDIFDERSNILVGTDYLSELFEKYEDPATVLMVYHGEKNAVKKSENGKISKYAQGILKRSEELEKLHKKLEVKLYVHTTILVWSDFFISF